MHLRVQIGSFFRPFIARRYPTINGSRQRRWSMISKRRASTRGTSRTFRTSCKRSPGMRNAAISSSLCRMVDSMAFTRSCCPPSNSVRRDRWVIAGS